jgi:hypothetical protein
VRARSRFGSTSSKELERRLEAGDVTEDGVRDVALPRGLVDTKVCAIDETWSGLRLTRRRTNRKSS